MPPEPPLERTIAAKMWPLLVACACLAVLLGLAYWRVRAAGAGQIFTLDDAYISAAIGRHLWLDHTWGVSPHHFSSASSSILWPLLLAAGFAVSGVHMAVPFGLNVLFAMLVLYVSWRVMQREIADAPGWFVLVVLLVVALVTPLPMMVFIGMEHSGFALASLLFMATASAALARTHHAGRLSRRDLLLLAAAPAFACSLRYEGMFQAAIVCGLFLLRRQIRAAAAVALGGALPIGLFGAFAVRHGAHFFPNSLLQKSGGGAAKLLRSVVVFIPNKGLLSHYSLSTGFFALWAVAMVLLLGAWGRRLSRSMQYALTIFAATVVLHCQFSQLNWLWRYESYLMATGSLFVLVAVWQAMAGAGDTVGLQFSAADAGAEGRALPWAGLAARPWHSKEATAEAAGHGVLRGWRRCLVIALAVCPVLAAMPRAWNSYADIPHSAYAIYEQQYQTGTFLTRFYRGQPVVLNDIGVPSYKSDAQILDLAGLGSLEVTDLQIARRFDTAAIARLAAERHSRVAILYRKWFKGATAPPAEWTEVGSWTIGPMDPRVPIADPTFTFFAVTPGEVQYLHDSLCANRGMLPAGEVQRMSTSCIGTGR